MVSFPPAANGNALVAQLDRAPDYESGGQGFESLRVYHFFQSPAFARSRGFSVPGNEKAVISFKVLAQRGGCVVIYPLSKDELFTLFFEN